jgi:hypothetical protein
MHDISISTTVTSESLIKFLKEKELRFDGLSISGNTLTFEGAITDEFPKNTFNVYENPSLKAFYDYFFTVMLMVLRQSNNGEDYAKEIEVVLECQKLIDKFCEDTTSTYLVFTDYFNEEGLDVYEEICEESDYFAPAFLEEVEYSGGSFYFELEFDKSDERKQWKLLSFEFDMNDYEDKDWDEEDESEPRIDLFKASEEQRSDKETVLKAVSYNGFDLMWSSEELRDDIDVVTRAAMTSPGSFSYASDRLRDDKELVTILIQNDASAFEYASDRLRCDEKLIELSRLKYKQPKDALVFLLLNGDYVNPDFSDLAWELSGKAWEVDGNPGYGNARYGFRNGVETRWPFGFRDFHQVNYFKNNFVTATISHHFIDFDWLKVQEYHLARVRFVYYTNNEPIPGDKTYDGRTDYFLVPYKLISGDRILVHGTKSVLVEECHSISNETLNTLLSSLPLWKGTLDSLNETGIFTIKDLVDYDHKALEKVKGLSSRSTQKYKDLEEILLSHNVALKKSNAQVVPSTLKTMSAEEAYNQSKGILASEIDWRKFAALHEGELFNYFDLSNFVRDELLSFDSSQLSKLDDDKKLIQSIDYETLIKFMDRLGEKKVLVYLAYLDDYEEGDYDELDDDIEEDYEEEEER